jgi:endogenous inhibitor of DNA gyrase (YacG/DUF329 family)
MKFRCPTCGREWQADERPPDFPFCSDRCRMVDLGRWLNEEYFVPGEPVSEEDDGQREK